MVQLTEALLDGFGKPERRVELTDDEVPTFGVRISPSGAATFFVNYTLPHSGGKKRRYTIGPYGKLAWRLTPPRGASKGYVTARDEARRIIGLVAHGEDPQGVRMGHGGGLLFPDLVAQYLLWARREKRTWLQDMRAIGGFVVDEDGRLQADRSRKGHLLPAWQDRPLAGIRKGDVRDVLEPVAARAPIAANRLRVLISRLFAWAAERDLVEHNPTTGTRPPAKEKPGNRVLSPEELGEAYRRCTGAGPLGDIVRLLILTWQRRAEVTELEIGELHDELRTWDISAERMKNKRPHVVPLPSPARAIIAARLAIHAGGRRLFVNRNGDPIHPDSVTDYIGKLAKAMGGAPFTQRDLRRSTTSLAGRLGITKDTRARILSHTDPSVTGRHYDRYDYLDEKREALEQWATYVQQLARDEAARTAESGKSRHGSLASGSLDPRTTSTPSRARENRLRTSSGAARSSTDR